MRDFKFRAWDKVEKKMRTVDDLKNLWTICNHGGDAKTIPNIIVVNQSYRGDDLELVVGKDCELMQYTGLLDKNGKEIYEGDIVKYTYSDSGRNKFYTQIIKYGEMFYDGEYGYVEGYGYNIPTEEKDMEVIGNIYENLELLEKYGGGE